MANCEKCTDLSLRKMAWLFADIPMRDANEKLSASPQSKVFPLFGSKIIAACAAATLLFATSIGPVVAAPYEKIIVLYAKTYGVPVNLAKAVVKIESGFRPNIRGKAGEIGLMQVKLSTARGMGYKGSAKGLYNPDTNVRYGMMYLAMAHKIGGKTTCGTILRYNAGHGAKRMNPISAAYCSKVKRAMSQGI
jgi:soluble lytic murein transglycosylase-like protein